MLDLNKLSYGKQNPEKVELQRVDNLKYKANEDRINAIQLDLDTNYSKHEGELPTKLYFVISGGEVRERDYLMAIERKQEFKNIRLIFISSEPNAGGLTPRMMYNHVLKKQVTHKGIEYTMMEEDSIYLFSDVDHYTEELKELLPQTHVGQWIISNPDFEIWLYYSYFDNPHADLQAVSNLPKSQQSSGLKYHLSTLKNGGIDPRKAFENIEIAVSNSLKNYSVDEHGIPKLFSTQMHTFAEDVLSVIGNEFKVWIQKKQEAAEKFRRNIDNQ